MGKREAGIGGDHSIERLERAGIHRQLHLAARHVGVARRGRHRRQKSP
jgi:hypothetical protein